MGMYTELVLKCRLKNDLPPVVKLTLDFMLNPSHLVLPSELPEHELFQCPRWEFMLVSNSFYHHPEKVVSRFNEYSSDYLFVRTDLKNYDDEIGKFIDWIKPYLENVEGECIGWTWYEEEKSPSLIHI